MIGGFLHKSGSTYLGSGLVSLRYQRCYRLEHLSAKHEQIGWLEPENIVHDHEGFTQGH